MISTQSIKFTYAATEFNFPDFTCNSGETILITGKSGTGKTTLLHILSGILKPTSGSVFIENTDITKLNTTKLDQFRGKNIGLVLQESHFIASLNVLENLQISSWLSDKNKNSEKALEILEILDLKEHSNKLTSQLSLGQQQRVSIARALINNPKVILADEPTSSLDDENTEIVFQLLQKLAEKYKASLVIVTHDQRLKDKVSKIINL